MLFVLFINSAPAHADCGAFQPLVSIHDAYRALLSENSFTSSELAANQILQLVPIHSAHTFQKSFEELELDIELARLEKVLVDAFFLGRTALAGQKGTKAMTPVHLANADWLTNTIARTGCFRHLAPQSAQGASASGPTEKGQNSNAPIERLVQNAPPTKALLTVLIVLFAGLVGYLIYHSRPFKIRRFERLPRHAVAFRASAIFEAATSAIIVLDISTGGAKIECDHPPMAKETITLHLPCGSVPATIVWATAFYAGVMFKEQLSESDLDAILSDDSVTTRSRISNSL